MSNSNNYLITVVGPTAVGKTATAVELASHYKCDVVSSDSRQFFRELSIGTAKPTKDEMRGINHHFINSHSISDFYSVGDFEREGIEIIEKQFLENPVLIMAGGSGLYVKAIIEGLDEFPEVGLEIREQLMEEVETSGIEALQKKLKELDPDYYAKIDLKNTHRVVRALEICIGTNKPFSSFLKAPKKTRNFTPIKIGLEMDRKLLYDRINHRVDLMVSAGLRQEAESVIDFRDHTTLKTVGYQEYFDFFDGKISEEEAIELIKRNSRRYAKRQLTWYKKDPEVAWYTPGQLNIIIEDCSSKMN